MIDYTQVFASLFLKPAEKLSYRIGGYWNKWLLINDTKINVLRSCCSAKMSKIQKLYISISITICWLNHSFNNKMLVLTLYLSCLRNDETKNIIMKPYAILSSSLYKLATEERPSLKDIIPLTSQSNRIVQFFSTQNKSFYEYGIMLCWHSSWNTKNLEYIIFKVSYILYLHKCYIKKERLSFKITRQVLVIPQLCNIWQTNSLHYLFCLEICKNKMFCSKLY